MTIDPTAATGFGRVADDYERGRPGYPSEVGDILADELAIGASSRVCDLAAATGKFTRLLVDLGADVVAVEPVAEMRAQLATVVPDLEVLAGTAEVIPLADGSADAVTVAQAFHWFDAGQALDEIHRVLRPGGGLALIWNMRDESEPWVAEMSRLTHWHDRRIPGYQTTDWKAVLAGHAGFTPVQRRHVSWAQPMTRDLLAARVRSISYVATSEPDQRQRYVDDVLGLAEDFDEPFPLPYVTVVHWCRKTTPGP
ncbi:MAG: class I SAM-dependent methyltransferase [Acidimicrobiales bacterium]